MCISSTKIWYTENNGACSSKGSTYKNHLWYLWSQLRRSEAAGSSWFDQYWWFPNQCGINQSVWIIHAQAFINGSLKSELLFWAKFHWKCTKRYRSTGSVLQQFDLFPILQEKMEQSYKKGTVADAVSTFKKLVDRQEDDEVRAITGSGPYRLNAQYAKLQMDSV